MSASIQEVEFKWGLPSKAALASFVRSLGGELPEPVRQVNHFFDTPSFALRAIKSTLRLREANAEYVATVKGPNLGTGALSVRSEIEWSVQSELALAVIATTSPAEALLQVAAKVLPGDAKTVLAELVPPLAPEALRYLGKFVNLRSVLRRTLEHHGANLVANFEVDTTIFDDGREEYEIELEVLADAADAYAAAVRERFASLGIEPLARASKAQRFFARLDALRT